MRVVGGAWKGRPLTAPAGRATRPTSDKVREAMFDVLGALPELRVLPRTAIGPDASGVDAGDFSGVLAGLSVLDLFAGSGALGIEALSRGAAACTFVESAAPALRALRANLLRVGAGEAGAAPVRVAASDVRRALSADAGRGALYTLVFADPPYESYGRVRTDLGRLLGPVLAPGAVLVVETAAGTAAGLPWTVVREKRYGDTQVTFLVAESPPPAEGETERP